MVGEFSVMIKVDFRKIVGEYSSDFPYHDPTTAWYEWNMYIECCRSLQVPRQPHLGRFMRYRNYLKEIGVL
jgi:hypothetical protein